MINVATRRLVRAPVARFARCAATEAPKADGSRQYTYFDNLEVKDGVAIVRFNGPAKMNTISSGMQQEAEKIFKEKLLGNNDVKAIVFMSSKPDNFIAGADIDMIKNTPDKSELKSLIMKGHAFFNEVKKTSKIPMVAAINGAALGGGLEWAMYCDYRIATTNKKTTLGLPEVKLGLMPGMAGTYHLPKLIGYQAALDAMLTGKNIRPDKAKKMGLVDLVVDPAALEEVAIAQAKALAAGTLKPTVRKPDFMSRVLEGTPFGRNLMFKKAREMVDKQSGGHYPAPYAILDVLKNNFGKSKQEHLEDEAARFAKLAATPESEALIGIFHGMTAVKKHNFGEPKRKVEKVGVLGAGLMGAGIAEVSLNGGYRVFLKDKDMAGVARGEKTIADDFNKKLQKKRMTDYQFSEATSRLIPLHDGVASWTRHMAQADIVIEAVFEELSVKHKVLQQMEGIIRPDCIFASNTSAIPIAKIAEGAKHPERVIGMHYFSPVPMMPLLEIITHAGTSPEAAAAAMDVGSKQGKTPIFVKDVPGFYVNRCLAPFMSEVTALVEEGADLEVLDKAMKEFGMPVGPITLCDEVGIDVSHHVGKFMASADLGVRMNGGNPDLIADMVKNGWLGRKTGKGFYMYPAGKQKGKKQLNPEVVAMLPKIQKNGPKNISVDDIQKRIISRFINEAAFCLQDEIIRSPTDGDIGAVFGIGFPPFLGGPFRMLDITGTAKMVDKMKQYRDVYGEQFEPCPLLVDMANSGKKFHPK